MRYVMGIDGGGTKTHTVIVDELGNQLGKGVSGCGNHQGPGVEKAMMHIRDSIDQALKEAGMQLQDIDYTMFGLAGADREYDFNILRPALAELQCRNWDVVCDTMEGLRIGSADNIGVVLVCGTGTNAAGRNAEGLTVQTGGFGYLYGDASGGSAMAAETFRAAVRSWEMREIPSILVTEVPKFLGYDSTEQMYNSLLDQEIYRVPNNDLVRVLHKAADMGDELAIRILRMNGTELGLAAGSVIRRLGGFEGRKVPIVLTGSVLQKGRNQHLLDALNETLANIHPNIEIVIPEAAPVYGSVQLAMDELGIPVTDEMVRGFISFGGYE